MHDSVTTSHILCSPRIHGYASLTAELNLKMSESPTLYCTQGKSRNTHLSGCCLLVTSSRMFSLGTNFDSDSIYMSHGS